MWHIMLCGLLALPALSEFDLREKSEKVVLTEENCESCPTCAKCAKSATDERQFDASNDRPCAQRQRFRTPFGRREVIRRRWLR